jgi:3-methyladenine DNA glycosylase AlkD
MKLGTVMKRLNATSDKKAIDWMAKYGITPVGSYGTKIPVLRKLGKEIGTDHRLAFELWNAGYRETMILASLVADPDRITSKQMDNWAKKFDYWEICDQVVTNLFSHSRYAWNKAIEWSNSSHEGTKRAAFVLIARLAVIDKESTNAEFEKFFPVITRGSIDERNMVKKAVSWALRQVGKRNITLNKKAIRIALALSRLDSKSAKWIYNDAFKELTSTSVQKRLLKKKRGN